MLANDSRERFLDIAQKIKEGKDVPLDDMLFAGRMAERYQEAESILKKARRELILRKTREERKEAGQAESEDDDLDDFLNDLNIGDPDPSKHLTPDSSVDDFRNFFRRNPPRDWRRTD